MPALYKHKISHQEEIYLTGLNIAELFWQLNEYDQAEFFNRLSTFGGLPIQLQYLTDCPDLDDGGRRVMALIGEYAPKES